MQNVLNTAIEFTSDIRISSMDDIREYIKVLSAYSSLPWIVDIMNSNSSLEWPVQSP